MVKVVQRPCISPNYLAVVDKGLFAQRMGAPGPALGVAKTTGDQPKVFTGR